MLLVGCSSCMLNVKKYNSESKFQPWPDNYKYSGLAALRNFSLIKKSTNGLKNLIGLSTSISLSMRNQKNVLCPGEIIRESKWPPNKSLRDGMKNGVYFSIALTQHREVFNLRPVGTWKPLRYRFWFLTSNPTLKFITKYLSWLGHLFQLWFPILKWRKVLSNQR